MLKKLRIPLWFAGCILLAFASAKNLASTLPTPPILPLFAECLACTLLGSFFFVTLTGIEALVISGICALLLTLGPGPFLHHHAHLRQLIAVALITGFLLSRLFRALSCDGFDQPFSRKATRLASMPCPGCGQPIGPGAALAASEEYLCRRAEALRRLPNSRIHFARYWLVHCPSCKAKSEFHFETLALKISNS